MPLYDYLELLCTEQVLGNAGDEYTTDTVNLGFAKPYLNRSGNFGLHMVVTTAYTGLDSGVYLWIVHGAATAPTTKHTAMFIAVADLTLAAYFFVPCGSTPVLQYVRGLFNVVSENATAGASTCWFGPGPMGDTDPAA